MQKLFLVSLFAVSILLAGSLPNRAQSATDSPEITLRDKIKIKKRSRIEYERPDSSEEMNQTKTEELAKRRRTLIVKLLRLIRDSRNLDQKASMSLRLGKLYREDYYAKLDKAQTLFSAKLIEHQNAKRTGKTPAPKLDSAEAMSSLDKAIVVYNGLKNRYPRHQNRDEILYFLALSFTDRGNSDQAVENFKRLTQEFPKSLYSTEAYVELGDYYFGVNQFKVAENYYDRVIGLNYQPLLSYTLYKKAWCLYDLGNARGCVDYLKKAIAVEDKNGNIKMRVRNEALKDLPLPFVDLKMVDESVAFFRGFGEVVYRSGLEMMAALYLERGDYKRSVTHWEQLLTENALHPKNPEYETNIVEAFDLSSHRDEVFERLFDRLPNYFPKSKWYEKNDTKAIQEAYNRFEESARKYAVQYHAVAQKTNNDGLYDLTKKFYSKYLEFFSASPQAPQLRFNLAEIQNRQKEYMDAANNYYEVYLHPGNLTIGHLSIRHALSALDFQLNLDRKQKGLGQINSKSKTAIKATVSDTEVQPYSEAESKFMVVAEDYLAHFTKESDAPEVLYEEAYLQYTHFDFDKAYKNFGVLISRYPAHQTSYSAAHLMMDVLNRRKDYPKLIALAQRLLGIKELSNTGFRSEVAMILRQTEFKRIELIEEAGNFREAGDNYLAYIKTYGEQDENLYEKALYDASINYVKAGYYIGAVEAEEKFMKRFPDSGLREGALLQMGKNYELMASFDKAAPAFEKLAMEFPKNSQSKNALRLAGLYYWGSGNMKAAENAMKHFAKEHPQDLEFIEKDLIALYASKGAIDAQVSHHEHARERRGIPAVDYVAHSVAIAELYAQRTGQLPSRIMEETLNYAEAHHKKIASTPRGGELMAKLLFWSAQRKEKAFYGVRVTDGTISHKINLLKELDADYSKVVAYGTTWGIGALYKTATAYRQMANDVLQAPVPKRLNGKQLDLYREELAKTFIKPFNEKAIATAARCLDKSQELQILSSWTPRCFSLASSVDPVKYPVARTFYLPSVQTSIIAPDPNGNSQIAPGKEVAFALPFLSSALFNLVPESRGLASTTAMENPPLSTELKSISDDPTAAPTLMTYRILSKERREALSKTLAEEKPSSAKQKPSFTYLNMARLIDPARAIPALQRAIAQEPANISLHNLLALSYLEAGNLAAAKVTWLALLARGVKHPAISNNLGVTAMTEGKEADAMKYFAEASSTVPSREGLMNLGFLALKYRNGSEAVRYFEQVLAAFPDEATAQVALCAAQIQEGDMDAAREQLVTLSRQHVKDPYARITASYFLMDVEKDYGFAKQLLSEYIGQVSAENDVQFQRALNEASRLASNKEASGDITPSAMDEATRIVTPATATPSEAEVKKN